MQIHCIHDRDHLNKLLCRAYAPFMLRFGLDSHCVVATMLITHKGMYLLNIPGINSKTFKIHEELKLQCGTILKAFGAD